MPVVLFTDALVWLLVVVALVYAGYARRREHLSEPWRRVIRSSSGMAALVVLGVFLIIGLLDSLHYRPRLDSRDANAPAAYSVEVLSILDRLLETQRTHREKTYSAPFATESFAKETVDLPGGKVVREFTRLRYGGAHLQDVSKRGEDIALRALFALAVGFVLWWVVVWSIAAITAHRQGVPPRTAWNALWHGLSDIPWRAVFVTLGVLVIVGLPMLSLSTQYHVLGTDKVGQDVLYLSLKSVRTALVIGALTTLVMLPFGVLLGIAAGYFKGWVDDAIQYLYTTLSSIPSVLLIAAAVLMMQVFLDTHPERFPTAVERADLRLLFLCIILGLKGWTGLARLLRGESLKLRELEYVQAAHGFGVRDSRIITRHILPNVMHIVLITMVLEFSGLVLTEAVLSYIGVGVDPSMVSFGTMINTARLEMAREPMVWWALASAFVFMFALVLSANLFADAVRDAFDPRIAVRSRLATVETVAV